jgi:hypothetical protein
LRGTNGSELGHGDLEVTENLQEQTLDLDVGLVRLVDEQDRGGVVADRREQRPREQELLAEDVGLRLVPGLVLAGGDAQKLLGVSLEGSVG